MTTPTEIGSGRETRLLLIVVAVAVAVLLVLARFRFPGAESAAVMPAQGPIERLAARATFQDLSLIVADVAAHVQPATLAVTLTRVPPVQARGAARPPHVTPEMRRVAGLRIASDLVLIAMPDGFAVAQADGVSVEATDAARGLALVRVPQTSDPIVGFTRAGSITGVPGYMVVAESGRTGISVRPVYIGRLDPLVDDRWTQPPLAIGGQAPTDPGALLFTLDGRLLGMTLSDSQGLVLVRTSALESAVAALLMR